MYDEWYNPLFNVANELYGANVYSYYFNIPFEETVRRHQTRSKSQEFGEEHMRQWWREKDFSSVLEEEIISCEMDAECIIEKIYTDLLTSVYKGYKQDKIEMRGDRAEMSDFPLYLNTVAGGLDRRDQTIGGFSFVVKIYAVPVVEIIG